MIKNANSFFYSVFVLLFFLLEIAISSRQASLSIIFCDKEKLLDPNVSKRCNGKYKACFETAKIMYDFASAGTTVTFFVFGAISEAEFLPSPVVVVVAPRVFLDLLPLSVESFPFFLSFR